MGLSTVSQFASFDQSTNVNTLDISPFLSEALIMDFQLLGALNVDVNDGNAVTDIIHYWEEDSLNSEILTLTISLSSTDTSLTFTSSTAPHVGDYIVSTSGPKTNQEVMQVTTVNSATNATVSRGFNSTTAASLANSSTVALMRVEQEFSDIGTDASVNPTVRSNYTQILPGRDLQISGSQLARQMATTAMQDQVAHQLENRMKEWKRDFTRSILYGEKAGPGSDTQYRAFGGARYWIKGASGQTYSTSGTFSMTPLNTVNDVIVALGEYPDTLVVGTDLVSSINAIEATNRRLLESDKKVGYAVNAILLGQGNLVNVVVDGRVRPGDFFLFTTAGNRVRPRPLRNRAMFTIAGQDWIDGKKRRILGEWGFEFRQPQVHAYGNNQA